MLVDVKKKKSTVRKKNTQSLTPKNSPNSEKMLVISSSVVPQVVFAIKMVSLTKELAAPPPK